MLVIIWAVLLFSATAQINAKGNKNDMQLSSTTGSTISTSPTSVTSNVPANTTTTQSEVSSTTACTEQALNINVSGSCNDTQGDGTIDLLKELLEIVQQPQVIIAFFIGVLLSAIICCLITKCNRKKQRGSKDISESLEMVTAQAVPLWLELKRKSENGSDEEEITYMMMHLQMQDGQAVDDGDDGTLEPEAADGGAGAVEQKEVEYSNIDFSALKGRSPAEAEETPDPTETEYAEIKKDAPVEGQDTAGEESEAMEGNKEEGAVSEERNNEEEPEQHEPVNDRGGEDVAVYSNVYEVMDETC